MSGVQGILMVWDLYHDIYKVTQITGENTAVGVVLIS